MASKTAETLQIGAVAAALLAVSLSAALRGVLVGYAAALYALGNDLLNVNLPPEMAGPIKIGLIGTLTTGLVGLPAWYFHKLYGKADRLLYTYVTVKQTSDIYEWITTYLAERKEMVDDQPCLDLRLSREKASTNGVGFPWDSSEDEDDEDDEGHVAVNFSMTENRGTYKPLVFNGCAIQVAPMKRSVPSTGGNPYSSAAAPQEESSLVLIVRKSVFAF